MKLFLSLKHWHLFLLFIVLPSIIGSSTREVKIEGSSDLAYIFNTYFLYLITLGPLLLWIYTLALNLQVKSQNIFRFWRFNIAFLMILFWLIFSPIFTIAFIDDPTKMWMVPFSFFLMFIGFVYCTYFVSCLLNIVENGRNTSSFDMVLFFIYPVGIWILQPRINRLFDPNQIDSIE